jgi:hypothetical protein
MRKAIGKSGIKYTFEYFRFDKKKGVYYFKQRYDNLRKEIPHEIDENTTDLQVALLYSLQIKDVTNLGKNYKAVLLTNSNSS